MADVDIVVATEDKVPAAQRFYESCGYRGAAIAPSDFVVLAMQYDELVGIGRLCQEQELLWLRGMQIDPRCQRRGIGTRILRRLGQEIGNRWCCCLPCSHLVDFYRSAGFEQAEDHLPAALEARLRNYLSHGLKVVEMVRAAQSGHSRWC